MKVALSHDWLTGMRGGEYVLEAIAGIFKSADLFTLFALPGKVSPAIESLPIHTSWRQRIPGAELVTVALERRPRTQLAVSAGS